MFFDIFAPKLLFDAVCLLGYAVGGAVALLLR